MTIKLYVEGGGNRRASKARCREGFGEFFRDAGLNQRVLRVIPGGPRTEAYKRFKDDVDRGGSADFVALLVDSEGPVESVNAWEHLRNGEGWARPGGCDEDSAHLMVQCMEAWLVADREGLASYFGRGFNQRAIPQPPNVEDIAVRDLLRALRAASRESGKGAYDKGRHSFAVLASLDSQRVAAAAPHAKRLIEALHRHA